MTDPKIPQEIREQMIADAIALKEEFFEDIPVLTASSVTALAQIPAREAEDTLGSWRSGRRVLSIKREDEIVYPAFQFGADGQPFHIVHEVLNLFSQVASRTDWDNAMWFAGANGWLGGKQPFELLVDAPEKVKHAAEQEVWEDIE